MSEIKPVACTVCLPWGFYDTSDAARRKHCTACSGTGLVYALPATHRIVSVELLDSMRAEFCRAAEDVSDWGDYASTYFQNKHDLKSCIAHYSLQAKKVQAIIDEEETK